MSGVSTFSEEETEALGRRVGAAAPPGAVLALVGDLGSGKTRFAKGVAAGLGIDPATVTSPTFVLMNLYQGRLPVAHLDLYRLESVDLAGLGFYDVREDHVAVVEWADRAEEKALGDHLRIEFEVTGEKSRRLVFRARGGRSAGLLQELNLLP